MKDISTKDRIWEAALTVFSEKGYDGVGVDFIAETAGMKGPSLYKHFKGKEDILNALIDKAEQYYETQFSSELLYGKVPDSVEELKTVCLEKVDFTMHNPMIKKVRRMLAMEQFRSPRIAEITSKHHIDGLQETFQKILEGMMEKKVIKQGDAEVLALELIAPVSLLIHIYDRQPEREKEVMERIEKHLGMFLLSLK